jgi:hypothetical protein
MRITLEGAGFTSVGGGCSAGAYQEIAKNMQKKFYHNS